MHNFSKGVIGWYKAFGIDHLLPCTNSRSGDYRSVANPHQASGSLENITSLDELREAVLSIDCLLKKVSKNTVFSDGDPCSSIMFIGEAPGHDEDEQGKPFVGQSGKLLNSMLSAIDLKREEVYITNIVFWRPPSNRTPSSDEITMCLPYVRKHITLIRPKIIVLLGGVAIKAILETNDTVSSLRGRKMKIMGIDTIATFHPAYLLRSPGQKALAFRDFITIKKLYRYK
ncbi:MAG: uracil-DNA glycosylase [Holosporales bacterium]|jgi:DNA polymerase|nr:uracil-DNA glycosylase [Holosporales bacterium]